jgi:hypothetical protein
MIDWLESLWAAGDQCLRVFTVGQDIDRPWLRCLHSHAAMWYVNLVYAWRCNAVLHGLYSLYIWNVKRWPVWPQPEPKPPNQWRPMLAHVIARIGTHDMFGLDHMNSGSQQSDNLSPCLSSDFFFRLIHQSPTKPRRAIDHRVGGSHDAFWHMGIPFLSCDHIALGFVVTMSQNWGFCPMNIAFLAWMNKCEMLWWVN